MTTTQDSNFHSSGLAREVDQLMDILYSGGVNNPMDSVEQISYLLFLRLLWEREEGWESIDKNHQGIFSNDWAPYAWGNITNLTGDELFNTLREAIERFDQLPGLTDTGRLLFRQSTLKILDRPTLRAIVQGIHQMGITAQGTKDPKGDMYEYLLNKIATSGTNGQFRTPRHIIDTIVKMVDPQPNESICDPAAGTAGFLLAAHDHILRNNTSQSDLDRGEITGNSLNPSDWSFLETQAYTGFDNDANMVKFGIMNLYLHNLEKARYQMHNSVTTNLGGSYPGEKFDVILANPPFAGSVQAESILSDLNHGLNTRSTELLFCKWFIDHLNAGGRAGVIVPQGVLTGSSNAHKAIRKILLEQNTLEAVIDLPGGVFNPYSGVSTAVLVFKSGGTTKSVWFYKVSADGFTLNANRNPTANNDLPDLLAKYPNREEGDNSINVDVQAVIDNDMSFNVNNYLIREQEEIEYAHPSQLLSEIRGIEQQILEQIKVLEEDIKR
jgi:type I restriction enzyme M protein